MKSSDYRRLKNGDRVRHVDGTLGTVHVSPDWAVSTEIVWDDGQRQLVRTDSDTDMAWVESDLQAVTEFAQ